MNNILTTLLKKHKWPLKNDIVLSNNFRIGPNIDLSPTYQENTTLTLSTKRNELKVTSDYLIEDQSIIISNRLENTTTRKSELISILEPLYLVFNKPSESWRHIYANGGTSEAFYPPLAFRTQERSKSWIQSPISMFQAHPPFTIESHPSGRSSNMHLPFLISISIDSKNMNGLFCGIEWSGEWYIKWKRINDEMSSLSIGIKIDNLQLEPGEQLDLPPVHLGIFTGGPDEGTNNLRSYLHKKISPLHIDKEPIPLTSYDHYFGIGNNFTEELLQQEAKRAAEIGLEYFVLDAGWFKGGFPHGAGNWDIVDNEKFPNGIEPLSQYVRDLGMGFGLWFDPERAVKGSSVVRNHSEWFVPVNQPFYDTQNYHINLAIKDAQDYIIDLISNWITRLNLTWIRWDYNIDPNPLWKKIDPSGKITFVYIQGLYRVLDTLMKEHPSLMIDSCASGGRRIDLGTIKRAHTFWISDRSENPLICRYMQARANRFLPGHLLNLAVVTNLREGDGNFDHTSVLSRMMGALSFNGDIASWSPNLTSKMRTWVDLYKSIRHLLVQDFYQLFPIPTTADDWDVLQFSSYSKDESIVFVFTADTGGKKTIFPKNISNNITYEVSSPLDNTTQIILGAEIQTNGLVTKLKNEDSYLWHIIRKK